MRVVIAEDSVLLREGLSRLLADEGIEVVAAVGDGDSLVRAVAEHEPDLAIVDVRMPPTHTDEGLRAAIDARARTPATAILVLSTLRKIPSILIIISHLWSFVLISTLRLKILRCVFCIKNPASKSNLFPNDSLILFTLVRRRYVEQRTVFCNRSPDESHS